VYVTREYQPEHRRVVSVDGEGKTHNRHAYTLLAAADDKGWRDSISHDGTIRAGSPGYESKPYLTTDTAPNHGLATKACFDFLLGIPKHKSDLLISFAFTYDATKIFADLPWINLLELGIIGSTVWKRYRINYMPRKHLEIERDGRSVTVWDGFSYWQMSFVAALESSLELFTPEQRDTIGFIAYMKDHRSEFDSMPDDKIKEYCYTECEFLTIMFRDFLRHMDDIDLRVRRYSGPGGLAEAFFSLEHLTDYMPARSDLFAAPGLPFIIPYKSYYGGRFEISAQGLLGDLHEYDIHSAYPAVAVDLPCLACGHFEYVTDYVPGELGFYLVGSRTSGQWAPFPFRCNSDTKDWLNGALPGSIAYVHGGKRWVTSFEVETAREYFGTDAIPVYKGYIYHTPCNHKPFKRLRELYLVRKEGNPSEGLSKIIKLLINSVYGKLAQRLGSDRYRCMIWAAWITGGTRAKVLGAALRAPQDVVSIATDGILSRCELTQDTGFRVTAYDLGTWEYKPRPDAWLGMPGIYGFGDDDDNVKQFKRRGLNRKYFPLSHLRSEWARGEWEVNPTEPVIGFMPLRLAVQRTAALDIMGEWIELPKVVKFTSVQHKRHMPADVDAFLSHDGTMINLDTITVPDDLESEPYRRPSAEELLEIEGMDGDDLDLVMWSPEDFND
jgi:hypothetical protein